jgi:2-iminobutanoate/2-iminopropanoate deaminase
MTKQIIETKDALAPIGPYSQATSAGGLIFTAGQAGLDPQSGKLVDGGIAKQTAQTLLNR